MIKNCLVCNKEFKTKPSYIKKGQGKFCSQKCFGIDHSKHISGKNHPMFGIHRFGEKSPFFGKHHSEDFKKKMSIERKGKNNPNWKGNNVQYTALHDWIRDNKHRIIICEKCKIHPSLDLANINHLYRRNIYEYIWLCRSCHMKYDYKKGFR